MQLLRLAAHLFLRSRVPEGVRRCLRLLGRLLLPGLRGGIFQQILIDQRVVLRPGVDLALLFVQIFLKSPLEKGGPDRLVLGCQKI